jgi:site-specific DNA-methyltransferase (adenine-specific)
MQLSATLRINGTTACKWDNIIPFDKMWERLNKLIKPNGAIVLFGSEPFSSALRMSNIKNYKYDWKWEKHKPSNFALAKKQPMKYYEDIIIFYKKQPTYNPQMIKRESKRIKQ